MGGNCKSIEWNFIAYVQIPKKFQLLFSLHILLNLGKDSSNKTPNDYSKYLELQSRINARKKSMVGTMDITLPDLVLNFKNGNPFSFRAEICA